MKNQNAFTLIEALITLTIITILTMISVPNLQELLQHAQDNAIKNGILNLIESARTESEIRQKTVTLCQSHDSYHCGGDWSQGQIIFVDPTRDGVVRDKTQIITINKMQTGNGRIKVRFYPRYRSIIQFHPLYQEDNDNGTIWYCRSSAASPSWAIQINKMGSTHVLLPDKNGEIKDKNSTLKC